MTEKPRDFSLEIRTADDVIRLLAASGPLTRKAERGLTDACLAAQKDRLSLVLDLGGISSMDGAGLALLARLAYRCRDAKVRLALCRPDPALDRIFRMTGLPGIAPLFSRLRHAFGALGRCPDTSDTGDEPGTGFDATGWAGSLQPVAAAETAETSWPNIVGRRATGPMEGFGELWLKRYEVRLCESGLDGPAAAALLRSRLPEFWPVGNRIVFPPSGVVPGAVGAIQLRMPGAGRLHTGVRVLHADAESFTFATLRGHLASGWITFAAFDEDGCPLARVQSLARTGDPLFDVGFRLFGHREQETFWKATMSAVAEAVGLSAPVETHKECVDDTLLWSGLFSIPSNAVFRSMAADAARLFGKGK